MKRRMKMKRIADVQGELELPPERFLTLAAILKFCSRVVQEPDTRPWMHRA